MLLSWLHVALVDGGRSEYVSSMHFMNSRFAALPAVAGSFLSAVAAGVLFWGTVAPASERTLASVDPPSAAAASELRGLAIQDALTRLYRDPNAVDAHRELGWLYYDVGNLVAARHHLETYLERAKSGPDSVRAAYLQARTLLDLGMRLRATRAFSRFIERPGLPPGAYHDYSALLRQDGFRVEAVMFEMRAIESDPRTAHFREAGKQWKELARADQAIQVLQAMLVREPVDQEAEDHFQLGYLAHAIRKSGLARAAYREALNRNPAHPEAHFNASLLDEENGRYDSAIFHLEQVLRLRPKYERAYFRLGGLFLERERPIEAVDVFRRYLVHGQDSLAMAEARHLILDLEEGMGKTGEAPR